LLFKQKTSLRSWEITTKLSALEFEDELEANGSVAGPSKICFKMSSKVWAPKEAGL